MMPAPVQPLFLGQGSAARFGLYHAPAAPCRGAWLYLPPLGEEMNKARRMAALQAAALARQGYAVLQLDLHGCGDSAGDFGDASWDSWRDDVATGLRWLQATLGPALPQAPGLWGLRLGALLALDHASRAGTDAGVVPSALLLWQPVLQGSAHLTQFLRLKVAAQMLGDGGADGGTAALRAALAQGQALEIAGYTLAPALALGFDGLDAGRLAPPCPVHWCEVVAEAGRALPPAAARVLKAWQDAGVAVQARTAPGPQFWATQEIAEAPALLAATGALLDEVCHA
ncbi:hydrolase 2, exosortase A system-associated [Pseudoduganella sp. DS3]|uniref:Hydrolase 2, exosortase A system-associated n=1 Tax=Pseudoduganella guangdongensis TaxID=2692179 RepID=A0A6N9HQY6_9BURK|nr:hydrolase 2, exosortase A system-associated [Pseudoduganella guangdongensis]MYN05195.1 hydrolase 2, exosortase A system-associated [Pseudoduganella guangdongensis]